MEKILVLDFGGQYAHLIARRFRNLGYYSEIALPSIDINEIKDVKGIVLSGSPFSVYEKKAPKFNKELLKLNIPILGLCYGHQLLLKLYGGCVKPAKIGEYGYTFLNKVIDSPLFKSVEFPSQVWMSHTDSVIKIPKDFEITGSTKDCLIAASHNVKLKRFTLQFHAEVRDTLAGDLFFKNFAEICQMEKNWDDEKLLEVIKNKIIDEAKDKKILAFLSGGVDSSVAFTILVDVLGQDRVLGLYINNGFMRENETEIIKSRYDRSNFKNIVFENSEDKFLGAIENVIDPQEKRRIVGDTFLKVRDDLIKRLNLSEDQWLLAQGTLYPDIIESGGSKHSDTIKTHHNRVEGIKQLINKGLIIEPLKDLYKDEVRILGKKIGLSDEIINRHPFPGPGISINLLCSKGVLKDQKSFNRANSKLNKIDLSRFLNDLDYKLSVLPLKSVGVQGDFRTYKFPSLMKIPQILDNFIGWGVFEDISSFITNNVTEINRVILQIFEKKPCRLIEAYCTKERLDMIRIVDRMVLTELKKSGSYKKIFQHLTINLPFASNINSCSIVLRPVVSEDVMTARFAHLDLNILREISSQIEKLDFVDALYYDITNKPPATFGWE